MSDTQQILDLEAELANDNSTNNNVNTDIPRYSAKSCSYNEFFWKHMRANWPAVLTNVSANWECRCHWTVEDNNVHKINFDYLRHKIGNRSVPVANCTKQYFNSHEKIEMQFYDFLDYWQTKINGDSNGNKMQDERNLYLKDWHLAAELPNYSFYNVPKHFASDWLNEFLLQNNKDDYRFVYMGPQGTWTPFHADVFGSYSWSTNIFGCKKWILLPPCEEHKLSDHLGNSPFSIEEETLLKKGNVKYFTLYQHENEAIFVPSGWYHQVWNLTDTISVNHNWFNACNLERIWLNMAKNMQMVRSEIEDCRQMDNFDEHCQTMLRASFGINYLDFVEILEYIAARRCNLVQGQGPTSSIALLYKINDFHQYYDKLSINNVVKQMLNNTEICNNRMDLYRRCLKLQELTKIDN